MIPMRNDTDYIYNEGTHILQPCTSRHEGMTGVLNENPQSFYLQNEINL